MHRSPTSRRTPRRAAVTAAILLTVASLTGCLSAQQTEDMTLINAARKDNRKASLTVDDPAMTKAQAWSQNMASRGVLEHTGGGTKIDTRGLTNWCGVAENVGYGPTVKSVHEAFLRSSSHRTNMLGNYTRVGTGVYAKGNLVWVTEIYLRGC